jgi:hypothetical protein
MYLIKFIATIEPLTYAPRQQLMLRYHSLFAHNLFKCLFSAGFELDDK